MGVGSKYTFHWLSDQFPLIEGEEFEQLVEDIRQHGLQNPIVLINETEILDGRNRYRACLAANVEPVFHHYDGAHDLPSLVQFVQSENVRRRHLSSSQRAIIAAALLPIYEEEAKERQRLAAEATNQLKATKPEPPEPVTLPSDDSEPAELPDDPLDSFSAPLEPTQSFDTLVTSTPPTLALPSHMAPISSSPPPKEEDKTAPIPIPSVPAPVPDIGKARDLAGKVMGVSGRLVQDAKKVLEQAPELANEVKQGLLPLNKAVREVRIREKTAPSTPPSLLPHAIDASAYEVIIADPHPAKLAQETGSPLTVADNAILLLHTDSKHIDLALQRLVQWGFTYQDAITWIIDQPIQHNKFTDVSHSVYLISTRGRINALPPGHKWPSIIHGDENDRDRLIRQMLVAATPNARRLDLFSKRSDSDFDGGSASQKHAPPPSPDTETTDSSDNIFNVQDTFYRHHKVSPWKRYIDCILFYIGLKDLEDPPGWPLL